MKLNNTKEKSPTMSDVISGMAISCWNCDVIFWDDEYEIGDKVEMTRCCECGSEQGLPDPYPEYPFFLINLTNGISYAGGIIAFSTKDQRDAHAEYLRARNNDVMPCAVEVG